MKPSYTFIKDDKTLDLFSYQFNANRQLIHKKDLEPINNLKIVFREIRDYFAGNVTGITRDEKIAQNIMRLLFAKIFDEKNTKKTDVTCFSNRPNERLSEFKNRIDTLFEQVKQKYPDIFENDEQIELNAYDLSFIVSKIEKYSLLDAQRDIIADAFEELIGAMFRGGEGQFFTPRNIVEMMIKILSPKEHEKIIDPACGSGGFLAHILRFFISNGMKKPNIFGIDKDLFLSKIAKTYLTILGENDYCVFCENSLEKPSKWKRETQKHIQPGSFDIVLTNPPFGAKIPVIGEDILGQFELGRRWAKSKDKWILSDTLRDKQSPQILFIERVLQLLKNGGRAGIVLPEGIFGNPSDRYIWEYIRKYASIIGITSLSQETFQPSTHTKTSVLFLEKKINSRTNIFMAIAKKIGHNKNGKEIFKMNKDGSFLINKNGKMIIDDDTQEITNNFSQYLNGILNKETLLGWSVSNKKITDGIYIPEHYSPVLQIKLKELSLSKCYKMRSIGELAQNDTLQIKRGNEIGSCHYGGGAIPFIRTTDIVNWEIKMDAVKSIAQEIYDKYKFQQDIQENDIFFVNDGTFLIGRCAIITPLDTKCVYQSHIKKIRVLNTQKITPFYLFFLLNTDIVQKQIVSKTFTQATLSTLGNRLYEIILPIHADEKEICKISKEVKNIITAKADLRKRAKELIEFEKSIINAL